MKGQKKSVIDEVMLHLPNFVQFQDKAILMLSSTQLESIKSNIYIGISQGHIEYSKDLNNFGEVRSYARSMVMNHLKKAKELNGGFALTSSVAVTGDLDETGTSALPKTVRSKVKLAPKGVDVDILPETLKEFAKTLI